MAVGLHFLAGLDSTPESYNSAKRLKIIAEASEILAKLRTKTPDDAPGLYLTVDGRKGQFLIPGMIRVVTNRVLLTGDGARPMNFNRDLAGACIVRDMQQGMALQWNDIGALCAQ